MGTEKPQTKPQIFLVMGGDDFLVEQTAQNLLHEINPNLVKGGFGLEVVDGSVNLVDQVVDALAATRAALQQMDFFSTEKIVWLRNVNFCESTGRLSTSEGTKEAVDQFRTELEKTPLPVGVALVVTGTTIVGNSLLANTFKKLEKTGYAKIVSITAGKNSASTVIKMWLDQNKYTMGTDAVERLIARVGTNSSTILRELEKLFLYTNGAAPTPHDVDEICTLVLDGEAWDLVDAYTRKDSARTHALLHKFFLMKMKPMQLIFPLEGAAADILLASDARARGLIPKGGSNWNIGAMSAEDRAAVGDLGRADVCTGFKSFKLFPHIDKWSRTQALRAFQAFVKAHETLVSNSSDPETVLEVAVTEALQN